MNKINKISEQGQKEARGFFLAIFFAIFCTLILCGGKYSEPIETQVDPGDRGIYTGINFEYFPLLKKSGVPQT